MIKKIHKQQAENETHHSLTKTTRRKGIDDGCLITIKLKKNFWANQGLDVNPIAMIWLAFRQAGYTQTTFHVVPMKLFC